MLNAPVRSFADHRTLNEVMKVNATITSANEATVVETLRYITEIVIWGDQNDPRVFEFFLEHSMVSYFNTILLQGPPVHVTVQVLQTINMLFDNINSQTAICRTTPHPFSQWSLILLTFVWG